MNGEREPALPKPLLRSVSPIVTRMRSIGTWNTSTASCARLVAMPCPIACTAVHSSIMPSGVTVTVDALFEHRAAGPLEKRGDAAAAQLAAALRCRAARGKAVPVG